MKNTCTTTSCLICNGKKNHYDFSIDPFRVEECATCGMMRLNPQPTDLELSAIYHANNFLIDHEENHSQGATLKLDRADQCLKAFETYAGMPLKGCLLALGYGQSECLFKAEALGLSVYGMEYSTQSPDLSLTLPVSHEMFIDAEVAQLLKSEQRFDYIIVADVLEQMRSPRQFLKNIHALLQDNGVLMTLVPTIDSSSSRFKRNKWIGFKPEKLWYFSKPTLSRLLYSEHFCAIKTYSMRKKQRFDASLMMIARKEEAKSIKKLSVIMAVFNEEKTVRNTIERVLAKSMDRIDIELIVVESQSQDKTQDILREYEHHDRVKIIWQEQPRGKGNAIRAGFEQASGDIILIQDADDEYDFEDYDALIEPLITGEAAFVLGARHGGSAWKMRQFSDQPFAGHVLNLGHWFFALLVNVFFKLRLKDPFTMFKVFRADCLRGLKFECDRFDFDFELLIKLVRNGYNPIEIPVNYRSRSFKEGKKVNVIRDPLTWVRAIVKFRLQKM